MDPRHSAAVTRVVDELLWSLRRAGFPIATSQAIDVARAVAAVGFEDRRRVRDAVASVVVHERRARKRFDDAFDAFFSPATSGSFWDRLAAQGFTDDELAELRALLAELARSGDDGALAVALAQRGAELDRLLSLAGVSRALERMQSALQAGFTTHRILGELGVPRGYDALARVRDALVEALGERGELLARALRGELDGAVNEIREHVRVAFERRRSELEDARRGARLDTKDFIALTDAEADEVRAAVRAFVERLRGGQRVRARHARAGRIDPHRTLRRALRTGGVPFVPARRARPRDKARLVLLCDVSDSVRTVARFTLELMYAAQELFERTRTFVFVSEIGETTELFRREPPGVALAAAYGGAVVPTSDNSNYGRVLRAFDERYLRDVDRRTTVVVLGDGRTNYHDAAADVLDRIRERARALVWLCPERPADWALGDSAMSRYAARCTSVLEVRCARDLERAARLLLARAR